MPNRFGSRRALGGAPALNPGTLPNLELRLSGTTITGAPGDRFGTWSDSSGHGRDATQATAGKKPYVSGFDVSVPNSPTGVYGAAWDYSHPDSMDGTLPGNTIGAAAGQTIYLWFNESIYGVSNQIVFDSAPGSAPQLIVANGSSQYAWKDASGYVGSTTATTATYHSLVYVFAPPAGGTGIGTIYLDGVSILSHVWDYTFGPVTGYRIAADQGGTMGFAGTLYEIDFFSVAHDPATIRGVLRYGKRQWGI